jgi:hypothetical protein
MPVANRGEQAAGLAHLAVAIQVLEKAFALLGMGSEAGLAVHSALPKLAKHVPPGAVSSGIKNSVLEKIMIDNRQNSMNVAQMRGGQPPRPGSPPGAPPGVPPGGAPPSPPAMAA